MQAALVVCTTGLAVALVATVVKWAPHWLASTQGLNASQRAEEYGRVRTALLAILAGSLAAIGAIYTARTFALNRQGHELSRQGQITDRFTRAVDQLGNDSLDVRLGGIYALERLARESRDDHGPIMEILTAFVREHARWSPHVNTPSESIDQRGPGAPPRRGEGESNLVSTDVQAVLTVLGRRDVARDQGLILDLHGTVLSGAVLVGAHLEHSDLRGAHLERAELFSAHLDVAHLEEAHLEHAQLVGAHLKLAVLTDAHLEGADLCGTNFEASHPEEAHLERATYNLSTVWPEYFDPTRYGAELERTISI